MRRIAFFCLAIAALSTTTLTAGTQDALAAKTRPESLAGANPTSGTQGALAAKPKQKNSIRKIVKARKKDTLAANTKQKSLASSESSSEVVTEAKRWIGTNPTGWDRVWCARFMNFVLKRTGHAQTGSDAASSFASYGRRVWGPQVGAIAVMSRGKNGGHVGVISGFDRSGNPIVISGNHNRCAGNSRGNGRCVGVAVYPRNRIYAYVMPK
jgi:uncharacterized protein (TIGR02594 family)